MVNLRACLELILWPFKGLFKGCFYGLFRAIFMAY